MRYLDADSTFNDTTRDSALWLLSAAADGLCQLASDRPASMRRLADLATPPLRKRREFESTLVSARPTLISLAKVCLATVLLRSESNPTLTRSHELRTRENAMD